MNTRKAMKMLNELLVQVETSYLTIAKENDLTYNGLMMLLMVESYEHLTQKQVCDALYLPKSSVHSLLADFTKKGYLTLTEGGNKKEKYIIPTPSGERFIKKVSQETETIENGTIEVISTDEMSQFIRTAETLADRMTRETNKVYGKK